MSTLDIRKKYKKTICTYVICTILCIFFNLIYSIFGHGVSSRYMTFAFSFSLVFGVFVYSILYIKPIYNRISFNLHNAAVATATVGSILQGIINISGGESTKPRIYFAVAIIMMLISWCIQIKSYKDEKKNIRSRIKKNNKIKICVLILLFLIVLLIYLIEIFGTSISLKTIEEIESTRERDQILFSNLKINNISTGYDKEKDIYYYSVTNKKQNDWYVLNINLDNYKYNLSGSKLNIIKVDFNNPIDVVVYNSQNYYEIKIQLINTPMVIIKDEHAISKDYSNSYFEYINQKNSNPVVQSNSRIKWRGESAMAMDKKSYKVVTYNDKYTKEDKVYIPNFNVSSKYILDSVYKDFAKVRNRMALELWGDISSDYNNIKLHSEFVELFINDEYVGLYSLTEPVNKSRLGLTNNGVVIKTVSWDVIPDKKDINKEMKVSSYMGYEIKYPDDSDGHKNVWYDFLGKAYDFYGNKVNINSIENLYNKENYLDMVVYNAFINNMDSNLKKNLYLYKSDINQSNYNIYPWDTEYSFGLEFRYKAESETASAEDLSDYNKVLTSFFVEDDEYNKAIIERYKELRQSILTEEYFNKKLDTYRREIPKEAEERDSEKWYKYNLDEELENIKIWIHNRLEYFDNYVEGK